MGSVSAVVRSLLGVRCGNRFRMGCPYINHPPIMFARSIAQQLIVNSHDIQMKSRGGYCSLTISIWSLVLHNPCHAIFDGDTYMHSSASYNLPTGRLSMTYQNLSRRLLLPAVSSLFPPLPIASAADVLFLSFERKCS